MQFAPCFVTLLTLITAVVSSPLPVGDHDHVKFMQQRFTKLQSRSVGDVEAYLARRIAEEWVGEIQRRASAGASEPAGVTEAKQQLAVKQAGVKDQAAQLAGQIQASQSAGTNKQAEAGAKAAFA